jgi:hypothetical protein
MHENNFEKQVSEKMHQFGFDPSDEVWLAVNKEINKEKKRRPLFWLLFLSGLALIGGGYYLGTIKNNSNKAIVSQQQESKNKNQNNQSATKTHTIHSTEKVSGGNPPYLLSQNFTHSLKRKQSNEPAGLTSGEDINNLDAAMDDIHTKGKVEPAKTNESLGNTTQNDKIKDSVVQKISKKDSVAEIKMAEALKKKNKSSLWQIGFTGSAGISKIDQSIFSSADIPGLSYNATYFGTMTASAPAPTPPVSPKITPGFSFGAGVFVNRNLSKRISLSAGINYHYYSTKIQTGNAADSATLVYPPNSMAYSTESYYHNGNEHSYTNQYHFIELPLTVNIQLNKSSKIPLIWKAGFSLSYMISSNALHFDSYGNVYYQNASLFNKFQFNGLTSFMVGFHTRHGELQLGPQLQYGITGLMKQNPADPGHLLYGGFVISFTLSKK